MLYLTHQAHPCATETQRALQAADGYLFFNLTVEALAELDSLPAHLQDDSDVLLARIRALLHARKWRKAEALSSQSLQLHPSEGEFTVQRAFALHQMKKDDEARLAIGAAPAWIQRTGILHYNLACYQARLGDLSLARECIDQAIQINSGIKKNARLDPDLEALWN